MPRWWSSPTALDAFKLSIFSVLVTATAGIGGCVAFGMTRSPLLLTYGLENCVDSFSSMVVMWRFYKPGSKDPAREALLTKREKRASIAISFILVLLGLAVLITALDDFAHGKESSSNLRIIVIVSIFSVIVFGAMTAVKFDMGRKLHSASLKKDAACSLFGTILSASLFVNSLIILRAAEAWWLDPFVALSVAVASLIYGLSSIYRAFVVHGIPVCNPRWWLLSQGDGMDEITGRDIVDDDLRMTEESEDDDVPNTELPKTESSDKNDKSEDTEENDQEGSKGGDDNAKDDGEPEAAIV